MDRFNKNQLQELAQVIEDTCVTLYMPTNHVESEFAQNPIRLKNLLRLAKNELKDKGIKDPESFMQPAQALVDNDSYWRTVSNGLAMFLTRDSARIFRFPIPFNEVVVTGQRFHLKPLFPLLASNKRFFLLSLSQNQVRLMVGTAHSIHEIESRDIPSDIQEALWYDDPESSRSRLHSGPRYSESHGSANRQAQYTAHGGDAQDLVSGPNEELLRFFQEIDRGLVQTLGGNQSTMLLLSGVEHYLPIYRDANTYPKLIDDQIISGSPDGIPDHELHHKAWKILEPMFHEEDRVSKAEFAQLFHTDRGLSSDELKEIVPAAFFSRVKTLFVPIGKYVWGRYDPVNNTVTIHDHQVAGDEDLLNLAAVQTYLNGGAVYAMDPSEMPDPDQLIAATFRFPAPVTAVEQ